MEQAIALRKQHEADVRTTLGIYGHILEEDNTIVRETMERAYGKAQHKE